MLVESPAIVDGSELRYAVAIKARPGEDYDVVFTLKPTGAGKLEDWTGAHINEYIGVVCNDEVKSIAYIRAQISSDRGEIGGRFTKQSAEDLAHVLNSRALPAPVKIVSEGVNQLVR